MTAGEHRPGRPGEEHAEITADGRFQVIHLPDAPPRGGVVVASPLYAEFDTNYRREVLLARALAARGFAVVRSHYRGSGNSLGDPASLTFTTMAADLEAAAAHLAGVAGVEPDRFVATRVAIDALTESGIANGGATVWWGPVRSAKRWLEDALRARRMAWLAAGGDGDLPSAAREIEESGVVDVVGYRLYSALADRCTDATSSLPDGRVLVVPFGARDVALATRITGEGRIERSDDVGDEAWWFVGEQFSSEERRDVTVESVAITVAWLDEAGGR